MSESVRVVRPFVPSREVQVKRRAASPSAREWIKHSALFLLTFVTATFAGILIAAPAVDPPAPVAAGLLGYVLYVPEYYGRIVGALLSLAIANPSLIEKGLTLLRREGYTAFLYPRATTVPDRHVRRVH